MLFMWYLGLAVMSTFSNISNVHLLYMNTIRSIILIIFTSICHVAITVNSHENIHQVGRE